jgi:aerobic carbon-monoxide dehydrogenase small subunit
MPSECIAINLSVNGMDTTISVLPRTHLADVLRAQLGLTGTHIGCEHGVCGACTIFIDGVTTRACLVLAVQADGAFVETIEGLTEAADPTLMALQAAFCERNALQCGFCTPGLLATAVELLRERQQLSRAEIRERLSGNYCRCTGYQAIVDAILLAASRLTVPEPV